MRAEEKYRENAIARLKHNGLVQPGEILSEKQTIFANFELDVCVSVCMCICMRMCACVCVGDYVMYGMSECELHVMKSLLIRNQP